MAKKPKPVEVKVTGAQQVAALDAVYEKKREADQAKREYDDARKGALPTIVSKVLRHWKKRGAPHVGAYEFHLPDGTVHTANVQNRQSTKVYDPSEAKPLLARLNELCEPDAKLKGGDVYKVNINHGIHPAAMASPKVRERILQVLTELESEMKKERSLPPEISIVMETKTLVLAEHALDRIVPLCNDTEEAMKILGEPVTANLVTPKVK